MTNQSSTIGIDVGKANLDIHIHPANKSFRCANTKAGRKDMLACLQKHQMPQEALAVLEASGGYERPVWICLQRAGYKVHLVQPLRARNFINAKGTRAKTDKIDAQALACFAASGLTKGATLPSETQLALRDISRSVQNLRKHAGKVKEQMEKATHPTVGKALRALHRSCQRQAEKLEDVLKNMIQEQKDSSSLFYLFCSMPGIGHYTAMILVAELPEIGQCSKAQIAALSGLAPYTRESGKWKGKSHIAGGRKQVRKALYMAALSAIRYNPPMKTFYDRLRANGKSFKMAITATMRKMIVALNSMAKNNSPWMAEIT
ncbi:MAG: IS110 family transposase [Nitrospinae bacterium]|nr:IS110 family transposase [Nitrospinota bacterium]